MTSEHVRISLIGYGLQGCRVIINMQRLSVEKRKDGLTEATVAEFTTDIAGLSTDFDAYYMHSTPVRTRLQPDHEGDIQSTEALGSRELPSGDPSKDAS
jgi:hypothetical protein